MAWGGEGDVVDVDTGVDAGQDDTVGEDDQGNGDQGNGDNRDDRDDRGDANVQGSDASGDTTVAGDEIDSSAAGIVNDFTADKAKDKDEDSLIAYDQYKGDPVYKSGDPSQSVTVGSRQATKDQEDAVGAYVMAVTSQRDPQVATSRTTYGSRQEKARQEATIIDDEKAFEAAYTELEGQSVRERDARNRSLFESAIKTDMDQGLSTLERAQYDREEVTKAETALAEKRAANAARMIDINETLDFSRNKVAIEESDLDPVSKAIMATENSKRAQAQRHMRMSASSIDEMAALQRQIKEISTFKEGFWKGFRKQDNKTKRQVQELLLGYQAKFKDTLKRDADLNTRMINSQGFTMNTSGAQGLLGSLTGLPLMGISAIQGLFNSLGIAYHKTDTEKELEALMTEWGLIEKEHNEKTVEERKVLCERKEGWEWDEDAQVCRMKSADRFSEDKRFVPQY